MNIFAISGLIIGIVSVAEVFLMFATGRNKSHYLWGVFGIFVALWGFSGYKIATAASYNDALFWWRIAYIAVIFIPVLFLHFVHEFLRISQKWLVVVITTYVLGFFFLITNFLNGLFIRELRWEFNKFYSIVSPTPSYNLFVAFFFLTVFYSHIRLLQAYKKARGVTKTQIGYIFLATFIGFFVSYFAFLPVYGISVYWPVFNITIAFAPAIVTYAIVKKELFGMKLVLTSFFVGVIATLIVLDALVFTLEPSFQIIKAGILVIFLFFGYFLIKSVLREIRYREEIRGAYEVERRARQELARLDDIKNQFIMASQHHLRTPLTSIRGYLDLIFGGTYGNIPENLKKPLCKFQTSINRLNRIVNEFLDISQFQLGKKVVSPEPGVSVESILEEIKEELQFEARARNLYLKFQIPKKIPKIKADVEKLKVALFNLVDNAIKYTQKGGVIVRCEPIDNKLRIIIQDTGLGISKEEQKELFTRLFERGEEARRAHGTGRGIGLYITYHIVKAHNGKLWAESEGKGKGSTFYVELPVG